MANFDLASARARLRQSQQQVRATKAAQLPQVSTSNSVTRTIGNDSDTVRTGGNGQVVTTGGDYTLFQNSLSASWEIDLFGGTRRSIEAARADAQSAAAQIEAARIAIAGEIVRNYIDVRLAQARLGVAESNLQSQRETLQIARWRVQAGLASALDPEQARQLVSQTEAALPPLRSNFRSAVNRLAVLTGTAPGTPDATLKAVRPIPRAGILIPGIVPAEIVRRRPDVRIAERTLASNTAQIGVQTARLYPSFSLSGSISGSGTNFGNVIDSTIGQLGSTIAQALFDGGRTRANIRAQEAATEGALADYRGTVLSALEDADNAYDARQSATLRERSQADAEDAARNAAAYLRTQYSAGLIDFRNLLDAERTLLSSSDALVLARAQTTQAAVTLIQALGGDAGGRPNRQR